MKRWLQLIIMIITTLLTLLSKDGIRKLASENILLRQQLIVLSRNKKRSPKLTLSDKLLFGWLAIFVNPNRLKKIAIILKPATILKFHRALIKRKYQLLFSRKNPKKPGPKGPSQDLIKAIVEMKTNNPTYGHRRIAMQINDAFELNIDKDVVRRVLEKHYYPKPGDNDGPSWLTFIGHMKDSLWSIDLFRCESISLKSHWVLVIMDQFTRKIIGFSVYKGDVDGTAICCMFNKIISGLPLPKYLSSDNDPLFTFHRWQANLRILDIEEIKTVPYTPTSHPFIERVIGTVRRELLDRTLFWTVNDLENKLELFRAYYNEERSHHGIDGLSPLQKSGVQSSSVISLENYRWKKHCRGLFKLPIAA